MLITIIAFIAVLGILVLVHELGHFISAKRAGLKVEEFGFGFPPRIFGFKRGETIYSINWIPFGGFVKILGEGGEEQDNPKSFANQKIGVRAWIVAAGVVMNLLLAFVLLSLVSFFGTTTIIDENTQLNSRAKVSQPVVTITTVEQDSPAHDADLRSGDILLSVNGQTLAEEQELIDAVDDNLDQELTLEVERGSNTETILVTPRLDPPEGQGPLGVGLVKTAKVRYPWYLAIYQGAKQTILMLATIVVLFWGILRDLFTTGSLDPNIAGPIGIAVITGQVVDLGLVALMQFTAVLSLNLALLNIIPFPALDGGRLLFLIIEKIRHKKVSKKVENMAHTIGFGLLILMVVLITFRDFFRFEIIDSIRGWFS